MGIGVVEIRLNKNFTLWLVSIILIGCGNEKVTEYYDSGSIKIVHEVKNGVYNGDFKEYFESGALKGHGLYRDGKLEGSIEKYFESGSIELKATYRNGILDGASNGYYKSGHVYYESNFVNGIRVGWVTNFSDNEVNSVKERKLYNSLGKLIYLKAFDENGEVYLNQITPYLECKKDTIDYDEPIDISINIGLKVPKTIVYFGLQAEHLGLIDTLAVDTIGGDKMSARFNVITKRTGRTKVGIVFSNISPRTDSTSLNNISPSHWILIGKPDDKSS